MAEGNITLRTATIDDLDSLVELWWESSHYHQDLDPRFQYATDAENASREFITKQLESDDSCHWVAQVDDDIVGYVEAMVIMRPPIHEERRTGFLGSIYVKSDARQKGIGTKLWYLARDWLVTKEIATISLSVAAQNPQAIKFWKKFNFREIMMRLEVKTRKLNHAK